MRALLSDYPAGLMYLLAALIALAPTALPRTVFAEAVGEQA
ncbi:MAG TPA: hypothetical protein VN668_01200 [Stellaceae bacterium]|nr:hypothetical protein [Stellaceae bacterium]